MADPWTRLVRAQKDALRMQSQGLDALSKAADTAASATRATKAMVDLNTTMMKAGQDWLRLWTPRK